MEISRAALVALFEDGDKPEGLDFNNWLDSFLHKSDDTIEISYVNGLQDALNATSGFAVFGDTNGYASHALMVAGGLVAISQHYYVGIDGNGLNEWGLPQGLILKRFV